MHSLKRSTTLCHLDRSGEISQLAFGGRPPRDWRQQIRPACESLDLALDRGFVRLRDLSAALEMTGMGA